MKGYKVVFEEKGKLISALARGKAQVIYEPNKWASAPKWLTQQGYHLTFFRDLGSAKYFLEKWDYFYDKLQIWECKISTITQLPPFCDGYQIRLGRLIEELLPTWQYGTCMAKQIKLIKKVWPEE